MRLPEGEDFFKDSWSWAGKPVCQTPESGFFTTPLVVASPPGLLPHGGGCGVWGASEIREWMGVAPWDLGFLR